MPNDILDETFDTYSVPIVALVVEGPTDGAYLYEPLEAYFREKYGSTCKIAKIKDVTSDPNVLDTEFVDELKKRIQDELSDSKNKIDYNVAAMIKEVVHIVDVDEAFIDDHLINEDPSKNEFFYTRTGILFREINSVKLRNNRKANRIRTLVGMKKITIFDREMPYSIYFFSVNIDDFHNDDSLNLSDDDKALKAAQFRRKYLVKETRSGKIKMFLKLCEKVNPDDFPDTFEGTWDYIQKDNNCLKRCSNTMLILGEKKKTE